MRILAGSIVIGTLIVSGTLPTLAAQPVASDTQTQSVAGSDATAGRATYTQKAHADMRDWQRKLHDFGKTAKANGEKTGNAAGNDLHAAWTKTQEESRKLETASAEGWQSAKASYEKASHDLAETWDRNRP